MLKVKLSKYCNCNFIKKINFLTNVNVVTNGVDALKYLNQDEEYNDVSRPDLLVLDLYMHKKK
jgi:CheY-like chemotaxis protein